MWEVIYKRSHPCVCLCKGPTKLYLWGEVFICLILRPSDDGA